MNGRARLRAYRRRAPVLCAGLLGLLGSLLAHGAARAPQRVLTTIYLEARSGSIDRIAAGLADTVKLEGAGNDAFRIAVLQEIERPERWIVLEWAKDPTTLAARAAQTAAALVALSPDLVAPPDRRSNDDPGAFAGATPGAAAPLPADALIAVTPLDTVAPDQRVVMAALAAFVAAARGGADNLRAEVWRQSGKLNHYVIVLAWARRTAREQFAASAAAREFRARIAPLLGSPYDERLCRLRY